MGGGDVVGGTSRTPTTMVIVSPLRQVPPEDGDWSSTMPAFRRSGVALVCSATLNPTPVSVLRALARVCPTTPGHWITGSELDGGGVVRVGVGFGVLGPLVWSGGLVVVGDVAAAADADGGEAGADGTTVAPPGPPSRPLSS